MALPVETKVKAATAGTAIGTAVAGFIIWVLDTYAFKTDPVPDAVIVLVWALVPAAVAFIAGRLAPHTARVDPEARKQLEKKGFALVPNESVTTAADIESDPRTDGVGDGGENELPPPSEEEIAAGIEYDQAHRFRALKQAGEDG